MPSLVSMSQHCNCLSDALVFMNSVLQKSFSILGIHQFWLIIVHFFRQSVCWGSRFSIHCVLQCHVLRWIRVNLYDVTGFMSTCIRGVEFSRYASINPVAQEGSCQYDPYLAWNTIPKRFNPQPSFPNDFLYSILPGYEVLDISSFRARPRDKLVRFTARSAMARGLIQLVSILDWSVQSIYPPRLSLQFQLYSNPLPWRGYSSLLP